MNNKTETRADNTVNYTYSTNVPISKPKEPIYKFDVFGDNWTMVCFIYEKKHMPNWFRRLCQGLFLGTKWTKL
jgi:hypothetical protein